MWPWIWCRIAHTRMHKLRDVFVSQRYYMTEESWSCRMCPRRRWRRLRRSL
jgi:hypothetical protein